MPNDSRIEHGAVVRSHALAACFQRGLVARGQSHGDAPSGCTSGRVAVWPCVRESCTVLRSLNVLDRIGCSDVSSRLCTVRVVNRHLYTLVLHIPTLHTCPGRLPTRAMRSDSIRVHSTGYWRTDLIHSFISLDWLFSRNVRSAARTVFCPPITC